MPESREKGVFIPLGDMEAAGIEMLPMKLKIKASKSVCAKGRVRRATIINSDRAQLGGSI